MLHSIRIGILEAASMLFLVLACATDHYWRALEYDEKGQHARAVGEFTKAIEADPSHPAPRHGRAVARLNLGDHRAAIEDLDEAIRLDPAYYLAYYTRGTIYSSKLGDHRKGIEDLDRCIELEPQFPYAYQNRGTARARLEQREGACQDWRKACELGLREPCDWVETTCSLPAGKEPPGAASGHPGPGRQ